MISLPLTRLKIENNNERLLQLKRKSNAEVIENSFAVSSSTINAI